VLLDAIDALVESRTDSETAVAVDELRRHLTSSACLEAGFETLERWVEKAEKSGAVVVVRGEDGRVGVRVRTERVEIQLPGRMK
jgi:hypothetical protein